MKSFIWIILFAILWIPLAQAQEYDGEEQAVVIDGQVAPLAEEAKKGTLMEKIEELKQGIPEVPRALRDRELTAGEQARLDRLERERANGNITETHYDGEKDNLMREANIKF